MRHQLVLITGNLTGAMINLYDFEHLNTFVKQMIHWQFIGKNIFLQTVKTLDRCLGAIQSTKKTRPIKLVYCIEISFPLKHRLFRFESEILYVALSAR